MFFPSVQSNNNDEANEAQKARMQALMIPSLRVAAQILSIVFHPLLLVVYVYWLLAWSEHALPVGAGEGSEKGTRE